MPVNMIHGADGFPRIVLTKPMGSSAEVLLYGGQVVSWKNERREELLFMSSKFGNFGSLEQHGFARNRMWSLDGSPAPLLPANNHSTVDLILKSIDEDHKTWPWSFELRL